MKGSDPFEAMSAGAANVDIISKSLDPCVVECMHNSSE